MLCFEIRETAVAKKYDCFTSPLSTLRIKQIFKDFAHRYYALKKKKDFAECYNYWHHSKSETVML